jgi:hypothetical protein
MLALSAGQGFCLEKQSKKKKDKTKTPEQIVSEMLDAMKDEDWEKAVSFIDIQGMIEEAKAFLNNTSKSLTTAEKDKMQKELEGLTEEKVRTNFIGNMKEVFGNEFSYQVTGKTMRDDNRAVVFIELSRNGKKKNDSIPLQKIDEKWMVSYRGLVRFDKTKNGE